MTASRKWRPGALRQAITEVLGASHRGLSAHTLAGRVSWSGSSVRRELALMKQLGLVRSARPGRAAAWSLTRRGEILWVLAHNDGLRASELARLLAVQDTVVQAELAALEQLMLARYELPGETMTWHLAGKAASDETPPRLGAWAETGKTPEQGTGDTS